MDRCRLDELLVRRGMAKDAAHARALILAGRVRAPGLSVLKAGQAVAVDQALSLEETLPFVSRGGLKLQGALKGFEVDVAGCPCVDIGASTGGFTDCLLQAGAAKVLAVDVGHGQLDWKLRNDPRVANRERTHVEQLTREEVETFFLGSAGGPSSPGWVTVDVSFISLERVLPHLAKVVPAGTGAIVLVKPQFEADPKDAPHGVVQDPQVHHRVMERVGKAAEACGFTMEGERESPLRGPEGNREFFLYLRRT